MKRNLFKLAFAFGIVGLPAFASAQTVKALPGPGYVNPAGASSTRIAEVDSGRARALVSDSPSSCVSGGCTAGGAGGGNCSCGNCVAKAERCERGWWGSADYMMAWTKGRYVPALVTTSSPNDEGVLGNGSTRILFGDDEVGTTMRSGGRVFAGKWLNDDFTSGFGIRFMGLQGDRGGYSASSSGDPLLATPFFNIDPLVNAQDAVIAASTNFPFPSGSIDVRTSNDVYSAEAIFRMAIREGADFRIDAIAGYHYTQIDDGLTLDNSNLFGVTNTFFHDDFNARNNFHGGMFGLMGEVGSGPWTASMMAKLSVGKNYETVVISGTNTTDIGGSVLVGSGGIFSQPTNIGTYKQDKIAYLPEISFNLNRRLTQRLDFTVGYTFMYWSSVVLAGDQIDTVVNGNQIGGGADTTSTGRPGFTFRDTEFFMHSVNLGMNFRF